MVRNLTPLAALFSAMVVTGPISASAEGLTIETLHSLDRVSGPVASPNGDKVAFVVREANLAENSGDANIFILDLVEGGEPERLTNAPESDGAPQWSADGETIYFLSSRSGSSQIWRKAVSGGRARQVSDYPVSISTFRLSSDGDRIVFSSAVYPDCDTLECTADRLNDVEASHETGMLYDSLFVRHWDRFKDGRRNLLFSAPIENNGKNAGDPASLMGSLVGDVPYVPFGGRGSFVFSPNGNSVFFSMREAGPFEPRSTDFDIYQVSATGGEEPALLTDGMDGNEAYPIVSPDGATLAFTSMARAGYESDQTNLILMDLASGDMKNLTENYDRSVGGPVFAPDGESIVFSAGDTGTHPILTISLSDGAVSNLTKGYNAVSPTIAGDDVIFVERALDRPSDIYAVALAGGEKRQLTDMNADTLASVDMGAYEQFSF